MYSQWLASLRRVITLSFSILNKKAKPAYTLQLISLLNKLKSIFEIEERNVLDLLRFSNFVGSDKGAERIFETSHPYQRGKT